MREEPTQLKQMIVNRSHGVKSVRDSPQSVKINNKSIIHFTSIFKNYIIFVYKKKEV